MLTSFKVRLRHLINLSTRAWRGLQRPHHNDEPRH